MSDQLKLMARLLAAVRTGEGAVPFNVALVDPSVLRCTAGERDRMALKLRKEGYIDGLFVIDGIDNARADLIRWDLSEPEVTVSGLVFMDENEPLKKAFREISDAAVDVAAQAVANTINGMP